jgi:hypothetical protein
MDRTWDLDPAARLSRRLPMSAGTFSPGQDVDEGEWGSTGLRQPDRIRVRGADRGPPMDGRAATGRSPDEQREIRGGRAGRCPVLLAGLLLAWSIGRADYCEKTFNSNRAALGFELFEK